MFYLLKYFHISDNYEEYQGMVIHIIHFLSPPDIFGVNKAN